ncbi:MAG: S8 family serine peptidase, partial [Candidatus Promineifilaceae bacterium]|nr:S8 family serine peptidase [Candidatus Promineifilaceae bacterium]
MSREGKGRRYHWLLLSLLTAIVSVGSLLNLPRLVHGFPAVNPPFQSDVDKLNPALVDELAKGSDNQDIRYIIYFDSNAELKLDSLPSDKQDRRHFIVQQLKVTAANSLAAAQPLIDSLQQSGLISTYYPLWIINGLAVTGKPASIHSLALYPQIARIELDEAYHYFDLPHFDSSQEFTENKTFWGEPWGIEQIQADKVWQHLGVTGEGVTVAIVDSGVDLFHPDLFANFRGNLTDDPAAYDKNWLHTNVPTSTEPFDLIGHGTHVAGTAVGQNGIGVAPGANWIAAAIADEYGLIYDSSVHTAFQWILAPGGDPDAAPDVVNNSWGGGGERTEFLQDVNILHEAGIITVFAAGNSGPLPGSILSPASFPRTIAVGASDDRDKPAWFSARGPSSLTDEVKPLLLAPGTQILSAMPDGQYAARSGTSMATPHVAGTIALLLEAEPSMRQDDIVKTLAETADSPATGQPNFDSGWGSLDAFAAVLSSFPHGTLQGTLAHSGGPLSLAEIKVSGLDGIVLSIRSDQNGQYFLKVPPGKYTLTTSVFGYEFIEIKDIDISSGEQVKQDLHLTRLPAGKVEGIITDQAGVPIRSKISVPGTPLEILSDATGQFLLEIPVGEYELWIQSKGQRLKRLPVKIAQNQQISLDIRLTPGPSILLLDSGQWRYESAASYYGTALNDIGLSFDLWAIDDPTRSLPTKEDMAPYDIVIWSAPSDSPGRLSLNTVLVEYLDDGGNVLISGQNVASLDGHSGFEESWFRDHLAAQFAGEIVIEETNAIAWGAEGTAFSQLDLTLNGMDSAANQLSPDLVNPRRGSFTRPVFLHEDGAGLGLQAGFCEPYNLIQLGFGLEGVNGRVQRAVLMDRALETLQAPPAESGVRWLPEKQHEIVVPGENIQIDLEVQNLSEIITDTFDLFIGSNPIGTGSLITKTVTLGPCAKGQTSLLLSSTNELANDQLHNLRVSAVSRSHPQTKAIFDLQLKTPGQILLVDDDRFFDARAAYQSALDDLNLEHDIWETKKEDGTQKSPSPTLLNAYDFVIWYTG